MIVRLVLFLSLHGDFFIHGDMDKLLNIVNFFVKPSFLDNILNMAAIPIIYIMIDKDFTIVL